jgi:ribosome-interacting GTPase 1
MPANLTPQYHRAEEAYRRATSAEEELSCLQEMLRELPKHKGTDRLQAELKQRISKTRKELEARRTQGARRGTNVRIPRQGAGRVVLVGAPNAGKSLLLSRMTRATPLVADYPFSTREPLPGMMDWQDVTVQWIDTPPITADFLDTSLQSLIRGADLVLLVVDVGSDEGVDQAADVLMRLESTKTRLDALSRLDDEDLGRSYTQTIVVCNQSDREDSAMRREWLRTAHLEPRQLALRDLSVSAWSGDGLDALREAIVEALDFVRVYTKHPHEKEPEFRDPFTVRRGGTLADVARLIHHDLADQLKFGKVWSVGRAQPATVAADYVVRDRDIVELHS